MKFSCTGLPKIYSKLILLAVVLIVAALIDKALTKVVRRMLDKSQVPNASIFVNILRVVVWVFAIGTLLQPVFGINPTTLFTALGIGGLAVSLGLKDTIANVIGGFGLMLGRVIRAGRLRQGGRHHRHRQGHQLASDHRARAQRQRDGHSESI